MTKKMAATTDKSPVIAKSRIKTAPSLRPDEIVMNAYLTGNPEAVEIVHAWRFKASRATIIRTVSPEKFAQLAGDV